jgi:hypothetical protein
MKKALVLSAAFIASCISIAVVAYLYWPLATKFLYAGYAAGGDYLMHLSNVEYFHQHGTFPLSNWQGTWFAGYPVVEGYPWLHNYLIQPLVNFFGDTATGMEYYSAAALFLYFVFSFICLFYISKNVGYSLLATAVLIYGADSTMTLFYGGFVIFAASQFFLPLTLLLVILARNEGKPILWFLAAFFFALAFFAHSSIATILIFPMVIPYIFVNKNGKINGESIKRAFKFGTYFVIIAAIPFYAYFDQSLRGIRITSPGMVQPVAWKGRFLFMLKWVNPVLLVFLILFLLLFIIFIKKLWKGVLPYLLSFLLVLTVFLLMFFQITGLVIVLLAERSLWALSFALLIFCAAIINRLSTSTKIKVVLNTISLVWLGLYLFAILIIRPDGLINEYFREPYPQAGYGGTVVQKYLEEKELKQLSWSSKFDNYRTDGLRYDVYLWWNLFSPTPRYKGFYPAMKGLPLDWSGLVTASERGYLGEAGTLDSSPQAINQAIFFLDWYSIRRLQVSPGDIVGDIAFRVADYLREPPIFESKESSGGFDYYSFSPDYIGPMYAPTNSKTIAFIGSKKQYNNFILTLSTTGYSSSRLIPVYLGRSLMSIKKSELRNFDAIFVYGYKTGLLGSNAWGLLKDYVENGGSLIIETGQRVAQTNSVGLPEVFPVSSTTTEVL